jgi:DNA mismatch repair protein MutS
VPKAVIRRAKRYLESLESMQTPHADNPQGQLPLAMSPAAAEPDPLRELLDDIDPDTLSPREALELLYKLKSEARDET